MLILNSSYRHRRSMVDFFEVAIAFFPRRINDAARTSCELFRRRGYVYKFGYKHIGTKNLTKEKCKKD